MKHNFKRLDKLVLICGMSLVLKSQSLYANYDLRFHFLKSLKGNRFNMLSIGDSITRAFNSYNYLSDAPQYSWSTGTSSWQEFKSHQHRFKDHFPDLEITTYNYARTGAKVAELDDNINRMKNLNINYMTYMIGANDVCTWPSDYEKKLAAFEQKVGQQIDTIISTNPKAKIVMLPVPDIYRLWEISNEYTACRMIWDFTGLCSPLLWSGRTDKERQEFRVRLDRANEALGRVADKHPDQVRYPEHLADYGFEPKHISSYDCFHPSIEGQNLISELTWQNGWYANIDQ